MRPFIEAASTLDIDNCHTNRAKAAATTYAIGMALLAGQRSITKKIATEIIGSKESNARIPVLMIFILVFK